MKKLIHEHPQDLYMEDRRYTEIGTICSIYIFSNLRKGGKLDGLTEFGMRLLLPYRENIIIL